MAGMERDQTIDGFRALAALGVVFAHAVSYRFGDSAFFGAHILRRLADPLAQTSVQIFFVISGFIITTLLLKEEGQRARFSLPAFYIRRACRIFPPLICLFFTLLVVERLQLISLENSSMLSSVSFTCNVGFVDCQWWVAHTWSLAVEEQFYLAWPFVLLIVPRRTPLLVAGIVILMLAFLVSPLSWHSNYISFICIGAGALCATSTEIRVALVKSVNGFIFVSAIFILVVGPLYLPTKLAQGFMPFVIVYIIFTSREIAGIRAILTLPPIQAFGVASYSLYLWQQVFLAKPELYHRQPFPLWLLPVVVALSVYLVEKPFIRLGRRLSGAVIGRHESREEEISPGAMR